MPTGSRRLASTASRRQALRSALLSASFLSSPYRFPALAAADGVTFEADDETFRFALPRGWIGSTAPEQERASPSHLISVRAQQQSGGASLQAIVDGGFRGRKYGSSLSDLGSLAAIANGLVKQELLNDDAAQSASVLSSERTSFRGMSYYVVRYEVAGRPAIAKLAVAQQRLYCLRVRAASRSAPSFFETTGPLRDDMEAIAESYSVAAVDDACLTQSNKGSVPERACRVLRP